MCLRMLYVESHALDWVLVPINAGIRLGLSVTLSEA